MKKKKATFEVHILYTVELQENDPKIGTLADERKIWNEDYELAVLDGTKIKKFSLKIVD